MENREIIRGRFYIILAATLWGTSGAVQSIAPDVASPSIIGLLRIFTGGIFLTSVSYIKREISDFKEFFSPVIFLTAFCQAMFQFCYFSGISLTGVAMGSMVAIGSSPLFTGILGFIFEKEVLTVKWYISTFIAVVGLIFLVSGGTETIRIDMLGIAFAMGAGFSYALFTLAAKRIIKTRSANGVIGFSFLIGSFYMVPFLFIKPLGWIFNVQGIVIVAYLGIVSAGLSYMFYGRGIKSVKVSTIGTLTLAEPLTASVLGIFFLGEPVTFFSATGMALLFASQLILVFFSP